MIKTAEIAEITHDADDKSKMVLELLNSERGFTLAVLATLSYIFFNDLIDNLIVEVLTLEYRIIVFVVLVLMTVVLAGNRDNKQGD